MSIKDLYYQLTEARRENDDLKAAVEELQTQNGHLIRQQAWFSNQILLAQEHYGECYNNLLHCCTQLTELQDKLQWHDPNQVVESSPVKESSSSHAAELLAMMNEEVLTRQNMTADLQLQLQMSTNTLQKVRAECHDTAQCKASVQTSIQAAVQAAVQAAKENSKNEIAAAMLTAREALQVEKNKLTNKTHQFDQKLANLKKLLSAAQLEVKTKESELDLALEQVNNQKTRIHNLQNDLIHLSEKKADSDNNYARVLSEVELATELSNGLSVKCAKLQHDHREQVNKLQKQLTSITEQLEVQKESNAKIVKRAVEQQKLIKKLSASKAVSLSLQVDKETAEQAINEGYQDLKNTLIESQQQSEHTLALLAYGLTHTKYVLEKYHQEQEQFLNQKCNEDDESKVQEQLQQSHQKLLDNKELFSQLINHITRLFIIIPVSVMLRSVDRLTDFAAKHLISLKALHMIRTYLPKTVEDAQACRQKVVYENYPGLRSFFTQDKIVMEECVCISVHGFMMLLGLSK